jgi:hypothetical protein
MDMTRMQRNDSESAVAGHEEANLGQIQICFSQSKWQETLKDLEAQPHPSHRRARFSCVFDYIS